MDEESRPKIMRSKRFRAAELQMTIAYKAMDHAARAVIEERLKELSRTRRYRCGVEFVSGQGTWFFSLLLSDRQVTIEIEDIEELLSSMLSDYGWNVIPTGRIRAINGEIDPDWLMSW